MAFLDLFNHTIKTYQDKSRTDTLPADPPPEPRPLAGHDGDVIKKPRTP